MVLALEMEIMKQVRKKSLKRGPEKKAQQQREARV